MMIPSLMVSVCELSGWSEMPSMTLPQYILVCCFNDTSLPPAALAEATVIVKATQANELKAFETILVIAECWQDGMVGDANWS